MGKHRHQQQYRRTIVAAVAIGVIGIPSVAMACTDWPGTGDRQDGRGAAEAADRDRWDGPDWYRNWSSQQHGTPSAAPSDTPAATPSPSTSHEPEKTRKAKRTKTPRPSAPSSATSSPRPTTASPKPTTAAPKPTTTAPRPTATASAPAASGAAAQVVALVNTERAKAGCSPVELNATLTEAAQNHSEDMAASGTLSHTGSDGSDPGVRITRAGYSWSTYGENVAYGYSTPEQVMQGWMTSPGHKANILNCSFKEIGVGLAQPGDYWTQDFGTAR